MCRNMLGVTNLSIIHDCIFSQHYIKMDLTPILIWVLVDLNKRLISFYFSTKFLGGLDQKAMSIKGQREFN